jgi:hypothetical protein
MHHWFFPVTRPGFALNSMPITFGEVFSIFFMQHWGLPCVYRSVESTKPIDEPKNAVFLEIANPQADNCIRPGDFYGAAALKERQ